MRQARTDEMVWTSQLRADGQPFTVEASWVATHWSSLEGFKRQALCNSLAAADRKLSVRMENDELVISGRPARVLYLLRHTNVLDGIPRREGSQLGALMTDDEFVDSMVGSSVSVQALRLLPLRYWWSGLGEDLQLYCGAVVSVQPAKVSTQSVTTG